MGLPDNMERLRQTAVPIGMQGRRVRSAVPSGRSQADIKEVLSAVLPGVPEYSAHRPAVLPADRFNPAQPEATLPLPIAVETVVDLLAVEEIAEAVEADPEAQAVPGNSCLAGILLPFDE